MSVIHLLMLSAIALVFTLGLLLGARTSPPPQSLGPWHEPTVTPRGITRVLVLEYLAACGVFVLFSLLAWMVLAPEGFVLILSDSVDAAYALVMELLA